MKKFLVLFAVLFMLLVGCETKDTAITGGWSQAQDNTLTPEIVEVFEKAIANTKYEGYVPKELLATQVVSGVNYRILCENGEEIIVNQDLQGNCNVLNEDYSIVEKEVSGHSKGCDIEESCNDDQNDPSAVGAKSDMSGYASFDPEAHYVFVNSTVKEMANDMAEGKSFVTYFGFARCPWCRDAMPILNSVANELGVEYINYVNTRSNPEWKSNLDIDDYDLLVEIAGDYLPLDDDNIKHLYVPTIFFVKNGEIVKVIEHLDYDAKSVEVNAEQIEEYRQLFTEAFNELIVR